MFTFELRHAPKLQHMLRPWSLLLFPAGLLVSLLTVPASAAQDGAAQNGAAQDSVAQDGLPFSFDGEIRQRSELDARGFENNPTSLHLLRTRLAGQFDATGDVSAFVQVQDSRVLGEGSPGRGRGTLDPAAGAIDLHQAYFEARNLLGAPLRLRVGRQELIFGNQRLVGAVGWSNVGRTFDGARLTHESQGVTADLFAARLVDNPDPGPDTGPDTGKNPQNFFGLYTTWTLGSSHELDAFALLDNDQEPVAIGSGKTKSRLLRVTPGLALRGTAAPVEQLAPIEYEVEFAYQGGRRARNPGVPRATISATLFAVRAGYDPQADLTFEAGYTRLSGEESVGERSSAGRSSAGRFNTLFATNHKFYGFMDFFPATRTRLGLQDALVKASWEPAEQLSASLALHHFHTTEAIARPSSNSGSPDAGGSSTSGSSQALGQEVDATLTYRPDSNVSVTAGASGFLGGDAVEAPLGEGVAYWGYLMSTVQF